MDLGRYIKSSEIRKPSTYSIKRNCMQCGCELENKGDPLYYQKFCSKTCKERYVGMPLED